MIEEEVKCKKKVTWKKLTQACNTRWNGMDNIDCELSEISSSLWKYPVH